MLPDNTSIANPTLIIHLPTSGGAVTIHDTRLNYGRDNFLSSFCFEREQCFKD